VSHADLLRSITLFDGLDEDDLTALASHLVERQFPAGTMIINQGDLGTEMYIVVAGHVNIHLPGEASRRVSLKDIARGEYFGELALFDEKPRSASAVATTDATLLELDRETLSKYLGERPRAAMALLRTMAERLRQTNAMLSERAAKNAVEEVEKNLTWGQRLADKVAEFNGSWAFIIGMLGFAGIWMALNSPSVSKSDFDPYPYVFFNLLLAILVALQGPLIMMSQNRQSLKDRATAETDFKVNLKNELNIETLLREMGEFRAEANVRLSRLESSAGLEPDQAAIERAVLEAQEARRPS
jgi:CRP/FNR family cyclic AMP-dependent transcriptional regulator